MASVSLDSLLMSEGAQEIPLDEASGHLAEVVGRATRGDRIVYLTDHGRRIAAIVPADEAWYWGSGWQQAEAEADADLAAGRSRRFDSMGEMFEEFDAVRGDDAQ